MHATIDGCIQLRNENKLTADQIEKVELKVHPLVMQLTSKKSPQTGLEGKFSIYHAASVALVEGGGGVDQFSDRAVRDRSVASLRDRVSTEIDASLHEDQVRITLTAKGGRRLEKFVEHAVGSLEHPMSDKDLEAKFAGLARGVLPADRQRKLMDLCWKVETLTRAADVADAARMSS
jgi:2-methylcitrate dehydratase PrpD